MKFKKLYFSDLVTFLSSNLATESEKNNEHYPIRILYGMVIEGCEQYKKHFVILYKKKLYSIHFSQLRYVGKIDYRKAKMKYLFSQEDETLIESLKYDNVSLYSVTDQLTALRISKKIMELPNINENSTITDATSCIGGNVISFARLFKHVFAVELSKKRYNMLRENLDILSIKNVTTICENYCKICDSILQDVVFIDPPWGGRKYKQLEKIQLYLDDITLSELCQKIKDKCHYTIIKVPLNYDTTEFDNLFQYQFIKLTPKVGLLIINNKEEPANIIK